MGLQYGGEVFYSFEIDLAGSLRKKSFRDDLDCRERVKTYVGAEGKQFALI